MPQNLDFGLYLNILLYSALAFGALVGFARGFKKSVFTFVTRAIFYVAFFYTLEMAVTFLWSFQSPYISQLFGMINADLAAATSIAEALPIALQTFGSSLATVDLTNVQLLELASGIGMFVLKLVYTLLYFTIGLLVYSMVCLLIRLIFFGGKKKNEKYASKNRGLGAIFGMLNGAMGLFLSLIMLGGMMNITESLLMVMPDLVPEPVSFELDRSGLYEAGHSVIVPQASFIPALPGGLTIDDLITEMQGFVDSYNGNIIVQTVSSVTMPDSSGDPLAINLFLFDEVLSFDYHENQISIRHELSVVSQMAGLVLSTGIAETMELDSITGENITDLFDMLSKSQLITSVIPLGIDIASQYFEIPLEIPVEDLYLIDWETEVSQLGVVASVAFDIINAAGVAQGEVNWETIDVDSELIRGLFEALGDSQLVTLALDVAVDPLLEMAGEPINMIITVPDDIVWADEFFAIGEVLGAVLDSDLEYTDVVGGNYTAILTAVSQIDFTIVLESQLVTNALINMLSGAVDIPELDLIVVPDDIIWLDYYDGDTLIHGELYNILFALNQVADMAGTLDLMNPDISMLAELSDELIDSLLESRVLIATLTNVIMTTDLEGLPLVIPDDVFDEDGYIKVEELQAVARSIKLIATTVICDPDDTECNETGFNISAALSLDSADMDLLLSSRVIHATVGKMVADMAGEAGGDLLVIPSIALEEVLVDAAPVEIIAKDEIKAAFEAISLIGITDIENIEFDASLLTNLEGDLTPGVLDEAKLDILFGSDILHATISDLLITTVGSNEMVVIPFFDVNNVAIRYFTVEDPLIELISRDELKNALRAFHSLGITDFNNITSFEISTIVDNFDVLIDSAIIHATVSKTVFDLGGDIVTVPYFDEAGVAVRTVVGDSLEDTETVYINESELQAVVDSLTILEIDDIETFDGTFDLSLLTAEGNIQTLLSSATIHATVSTMLFDMTGVDGVLSVPYFDEAENPIRLSVGDVLEGTDTTYLVKSEIEAIIDALDVLAITDLEGFDGTFDMSLLTAEGNVTILLNSAVIHATVSDLLFDMTGGDGVLTIPYFDEDSNPIRIVVGNVLENTDTTYLAKTEVEAIVDGLDVFGITDIESFDGTFDMSSLTAPGNIDILLTSAVIHATVSQTLLDMSTGIDAALTIPYYDENANPIRVTVGNVLEGTDTEYLLKTEVNAIIDGLDVFGITDIENFTGAFDMSALTAPGNIDILLTSAVIHATVSKTLFDMAEGAGAVLTIPYFDEDANPIRVTVGDELLDTDTTYLLKTEVSAIIDGLDVFGITDIENFTGSFDMAALTVDGNIEILLASAVIHATVSKTLFDMSIDDPLTLEDEATLKIPYFDEDANPIRVTVGDDLLDTDTTYLRKTEITAIIDGLDVFGITDIENFTGSFDMSALTAPGNIAILLTSAVIHATVSDTLFGMGEGIDAALQIPYFDETGAPIRITVGDDLDNTETVFLLKTEIEAIVDALNVLEMTDLEAFTGGFDMSLLTVEGNIEVLLASAVIHATVSDTILGMDGGALTIPYFDETATAIRVSVGDDIAGTDTLYLLKTEITAIVDGLDVLGMTDLEGFTGTFDMALLTAPGNIDILLASAVIHATVSDTILGMDGGALTIPYFDETDTAIRVTVGDEIDGTDTLYLLKTEISAIVDGLDVLGMTDLESFTGTFDMALLTVPGNIDILLTSAVIHATVSDTILDMDGGALNIPYFDETDTAIRVTVGDDLAGTDTLYLLKTEITAIVNGLDVLGMTDLEGFTGTFDMSLLTAPGNIDILLTSAVIHATISDTLIGMDGGSLVIPNFDEAANPILVEVGVVLDSTDTLYLVKTEIEALVAGLDRLNMTNLDSFGGTFDMSLLTTGDNITVLLASAIIHATISDTLLGMDGGALVIPHFDEADDAIIVEVGVVLDGTDTIYLVKTEIEYLVDGLDVFGVTNLDSFTGTFDMATLTTPGNLNTMLLSAIIHATISDTLFGMSASLMIPYFDEIDTPVIVAVGDILDSTDTTYITKVELNALVSGLDTLGMTDLDDFTGTFDMATLTTPGNLDTMLASAIIHATISDTLFDMTGSLLIPHFDETNAAVIVAVGDILDNTDTSYITKVELGSLVDGLDTLGMTNLDDFTGTFEMATLTAPGNLDTLLLSAIIHATISDTLFGMTASLMIPHFDVSSTAVIVEVGVVLDNTDTQYVTKVELADLVAGLDALGMTNLDDFTGTFDLASLTAGDNLTTMLQSAIIHATISDTLIDMDGSSINLPHFDETDAAIQILVGNVIAGTDTTYVDTDELVALVDALDILGVNDIGSFTGTVSFTNLFVGGNLDTVLLSSIIQATISDQMFDLDTAGTITIPEQDITAASIILEVGDSLENTDTTYVKATEIKYFFEAMNMLGTFDNVDSFDGNFSLTVLSTLENQNKLLLSATMHLTVSETVLDLSDDVLIVPLDDQADADIQVTTTETFVVKNEVKALINAFIEMGFTDLDSFGASLSSTAFFENTDILLLSASIQATISDKMLNDTGNVLVVPDDDILTLAQLRFVHPDVELIDADEVKAIMAALDAMGLTDFSTMAFNPANIFAQDLDTLLASASMRATVSKTLLNAASDETVAAGFSGLIVPRAVRQTIQVGSVDATQIESVELRALLDSLDMLGVTDFSDNFNPAVIMTMNETELNDFLASGSIHNTIDKMLKGNANISGSIPTQATFTMYPASAYPILSVTTKAELVAFILAVQKLGGGDFTTINITFAGVMGLSEVDRNIVLNSMIVRNIMTSDTETAVAAKNINNLPLGPFFTLDAEDYEDNNITTFFTYLDLLEIVKFLNDQPFVD